MAPVCARIDGRAFHTWTKGLDEPYDDLLRETFINVAKNMIRETGAYVAHTFSDEISLVFIQEDWKSQIFFDGRHQKLCSILASLVTGLFLENLPTFMSRRHQGHPIPAFDCRVWSMPDLGEAANYIFWRERDAERNSIQMLAQSLYDHSDLQGKSNSELQEMCFQKTYNWDGVQPMHKRGAIVRKVAVTRPFTSQEINELPPEHKARQDPDLKVVRREISVLDIKPLCRYTHDERIAILFGDKVRAEDG
jgi:tRNA(His) 5'-end guanylyltransferase